MCDCLDVWKGSISLVNLPYQNGEYSLSIIEYTAVTLYQPGGLCGRVLFAEGVVAVLE